MKATAIVAAIPIQTKIPTKSGHLGFGSARSGFIAQTAG
jgi:hypothetical protein